MSPLKHFGPLTIPEKLSQRSSWIPNDFLTHFLIYLCVAFEIFYPISYCQICSIYVSEKILGLILNFFWGGGDFDF